MNDSIDGAVRILGRQVVDSWFTFEVNDLLDAEEYLITTHAI